MLPWDTDSSQPAFGSFDDGGREESRIACAMCRQEMPARRFIRIGGRDVCLSCASAWFEEEPSD